VYGEEGDAHGVEELAEAIESLRADQISHSIFAAHESDLMDALREQEITLEICPTSNLLTKVLADEGAVRATFRAFVEHGVQFTNPTGGPEMMRTHLRDEPKCRTASTRTSCERRTSAATRPQSSPLRARTPAKLEIHPSADRG
jgi:adenosine deaminase